MAQRLPVKRPRPHLPIIQFVRCHKMMIPPTRMFCNIKKLDLCLWTWVCFHKLQRASKCFYPCTLKIRWSISNQETLSPVRKSRGKTKVFFSMLRTWKIKLSRNKVGWGKYSRGWNQKQGKISRSFAGDARITDCVLSYLLEGLFKRWKPHWWWKRCPEGSQL